MVQYRVGHPPKESCTCWAPHGPFCIPISRTFMQNEDFLFHTHFHDMEIHFRYIAHTLYSPCIVWLCALPEDPEWHVLKPRIHDC
jgi:hypothetical protein